MKTPITGTRRVRSHTANNNRGVAAKAGIILIYETFSFAEVYISYSFRFRQKVARLIPIISAAKVTLP